MVSDGTLVTSSTCQINLKLLPAKAVLFFYQGAETTIMRFLSVYLVSVGLTTSETGIIEGVQPFLKFLASPVLCGLADRFKCHKTMLTLVIVLNVLFWLSILAVPDLSKKPIECNYHHNINAKNFSLITDDVLKASKTSCQIDSTILAYKQREFVHFCDDSTAYNWPRNLSLVGHNESIATFQHYYGLERIRTEKPLRHLITKSEDTIYYEKLECNVVQCHNRSVRICCCFTRNFSKNVSLTFWVILILFSVGSIFHAPVFNLSTAMVYNILDSEWSDFGKQYLWGSISNIVAVIGATTYMNFSSSGSNIVSYRPCFYIFATGMISCALSSFPLPMQKKVLSNDSWTKALKILKSSKIMCFLITIVVTGMYTSSIIGFLFVHLSMVNTAITAEIYKPIIFGLYIATDSLVEIPALYFLGNLINVIGPYNCLVLASVTFAIRFALFTLITNAWWIILTAPLNSLTFMLVEVTTTSYANLMTVPGLSAIAQGIVGAFHTGIGWGLGLLLTGYLFEELGSIWTYRLYSVSSIFVLVPFICIQRWLFTDSEIKTKSNKDREQVYEAIP